MELIITSRDFRETKIFIDSQDFHFVDKIRWSIGFNTHGKGLFVKRSNKGKTLLLHRLIMNVNDRDIHVDHINHNGLDNRRCNLRLCTHTQNMKNKSSKINGTSKYLGVCWHKVNKKWTSNIRCSNKLLFLGYFTDEIEAAKAYDNAAKEVHGEFANFNFK